MMSKDSLRITENVFVMKRISALAWMIYNIMGNLIQAQVRKVKENSEGPARPGPAFSNLLHLYHQNYYSLIIKLNYKYLFTFLSFWFNHNKTAKTTK